MTPEAQRFVGQAQTCIGRAETMLTVDLNEDAGRTAYLACFQARTNSKQSPIILSEETLSYRASKRWRP